MNSMFKDPNVTQNHGGSTRANKSEVRWRGECWRCLPWEAGCHRAANCWTSMSVSQSVFIMHICLGTWNNAEELVIVSVPAQWSFGVIKHPYLQKYVFFQISVFFGWLFHKQTSQCHRKNTMITNFCLVFLLWGANSTNSVIKLDVFCKTSNHGAFSPASEQALSYLTLLTKNETTDIFYPVKIYPS